MNISKPDSYQEGLILFTQQLKEHLKKTRHLSLEFRWEENQHDDQLSAFVEVHKTIKLTLNCEDVETFATEYDKTYQKDFLEKQERRILKQLQQKSDE